MPTDSKKGHAPSPTPQQARQVCQDTLDVAGCDDKGGTATSWTAGC